MFRNIVSWTAVLLVGSSGMARAVPDGPKPEPQTNKIPVSPLASKQILTRKDLDRLPFPSRPKDSKDLFQVGVWMSKAEYRQGEPVHALFVLKNHGKEMGIDFLAPIPVTHSTAINRGRIQIQVIRYDMAKKKQLRALSSRTCILTSGPLSRVETNSYWCFRRNLGSGRLVPGVYEVCWAYGSQRSNKVAFRVLQQRMKQPFTQTFVGRPIVHCWYDLYARRVRTNINANHSSHHTYFVKGWHRRRWQNLASDLAAGHRVGKQQRWYTNPYDLPTADRFLKVNGKMIAAKKPRSQAPRAIEIQLQPVSADKRVQFENLHLSLSLLVIPAPGAKLLTSQQAAVKRKGLVIQGIKGVPKDARRTTMRESGQWRVQIQLPKDWSRDLPFHGPAVCAVVVGNEHIRRRRGAQINQAQVNIITIRNPNVLTRWQGLLRTPWMKMDVPE